MEAMDRGVYRGLASVTAKSAPLLQPEVAFGRRAGSTRHFFDNIIAQDTDAQDLLVKPTIAELPNGNWPAALMTEGSPTASSHLRKHGRPESPLYTCISVPQPQPVSRSGSPAKPVTALQSLWDARFEATSRALALDKESSSTLPPLSSGLSQSASTSNLSDQHFCGGEIQHPSMIVKVATRHGSFTRSIRKGSVFPVSMQADDKPDHLLRPKSGKDFNVQELKQQAAVKASTGNAATQFFKRVLKGIGMGSDEPTEAGIITIYEKPCLSDRSVRPEHPSKKAAERKPRESGQESAVEDAPRRSGATVKPLLGTDSETHVLRSMARLNCRW